MKKIYKTLHTAIVITLFITNAVNAKVTDDAATSSNNVNNVTAAQIESRMRPYLEQRVRNSRRNADANTPRRIDANVATPTTSDFFAIIHFWDDLSSDFHELYKLANAAALNNHDTFHISTSGRFKIHYSLTGPDSVDATDVLSVGNGTPSSWRERRDVPNGVPDYVDETAFALDSAYAMIVGRFGFAEPLNSPDENGDLYYYNVFIVSFRDGAVYGSSMPHSRPSQTDPGFSSYIELNNNFSSPAFANLGYDKNPEYAIYVTCVHELFHAAQYAMTWSRNLSPLSMGFLEGSAVLMEEIAFPDINDYLQYLRQFFNNPRITMLGSTNVYTNSIIMKYIYENSNSTDSIGFVRNVLFNNLQERNLNFHRNLEMSANESANSSWAKLLNGFHTESYFTGTRSRPWAFVSDAPLMRTWSVPTATPLPASDSLQYPSNSARYFYYTPHRTHNDTLTISIRGSNDPTFSGETWAASVIILESADSARIERITMNANGSGTIEIANWKEKRGVLTVVSNGAPTQRWARVRANSFEFEDNDTIPSNVPLAIAPNTTRAGSQTPIRIRGSNITEITILTQDGRFLGRYNQNSHSQIFSRGEDNVIEWHPNSRTAPGVYFVTVSSQNPLSNRRQTLRRKVMILP